MYAVIFIHPTSACLVLRGSRCSVVLGIITLEDLFINTISMIRTAILYNSSMIIFSHICLFNENKE